MGWKCPECGYETNSDETKQCRGCGTIHIPPSFGLVSDTAGRTLAFRIDTVCGKNMIRNIVGDDYRYADQRQFKLSKQNTGLYIYHENEAVNKTLYNNSIIPPEGCQLATGGIITIGNDLAKMRVEFE